MSMLFLEHVDRKSCIIGFYRSVTPLCYRQLCNFFDTFVWQKLYNNVSQEGAPFTRIHCMKRSNEGGYLLKQKERNTNLAIMTNWKYFLYCLSVSEDGWGKNSAYRNDTHLGEAFIDIKRYKVWTRIGIERIHERTRR